MAHAEAPGYRAHVTAATFAAATLLRSRTLEIVAAAGSARRAEILRWTRAGSLQIHAGRTTDSVLLSDLHQAAVHRRAGRLARRVAAEERPRRIGNLQRFTSRTDRRQGLGLPTAGQRGTRRPRATHLDQLACLSASWTGDTATRIPTLALGTSGMLVDLESQWAEHTTAVSRTGARLVAVDSILVEGPGAGDFGADRVDAPADAFRLALYPLKLAGDVVASRDELRRALGAEGTRPPHGRQSQLLASGQLTRDAAEAARGPAASFLRRVPLALEVILAGRRPRRTHVLLLEGRTSTEDLRRWLCYGDR